MSEASFTKISSSNMLTVRFLSLRNLRRLVYLGCVWLCICYLVFRVAHPQNAVSYLAHIHRGLLQKLPSEGPTQPSLNALIPENFLDLMPLVDKSPSLGEKELLFFLSNRSNLPLAYWAKNRNKAIGDKNCAKFPSLFDLDFNNVYWQRLQTTNGTFYLYAAYYDNRIRAGSTAIIRILAMVDKIKPISTTCQLWFDKGKSPVFAQATYTYAWYSKWGNYKDGILQPFIVSCKLPKKETEGRIPASVSLVQTRCQNPNNNLRIVNNRPPKKHDFAVCVKGLDFLQEDLSVRLVEWLEVLNILGAKKVFMYELEIHPNISKVLSYYQNKGLVELTPITLPGNQPNIPGFRHLYLKSKLTHKRQNEVIPYNDCLYRNIYSYDYLVLLDVDEVIMPVKHTNWRELMAEVVPAALKLKNYTRASYNVRNVYFLDDLQDGEELHHEAHEQGIPPYLHMLQHVYRSKNFTKPGSYVKCFHNTERSVSLHNHFPLNCFGSCTTYSIPIELAQLQHYRKDCVGSLKKTCKSEFRAYTVRDTTIWRYKNELTQRVTEVLNKLGFFRS
ncbi:uncharacterized protein LOC106461494 isoform X1 [Limulus polyphemus]|uniref:Glycosyltransferase family 92 protein n=2 Tax=Limulus polyphemus TaxID=6850 RepID=A0ABM1SKL9_LIMPO|nr:uncharacterized protein LOC106461494 isoform X1 [Limulus polyphemus]